jgi:signal transduction histidine kinase
MATEMLLGNERTPRERSLLELVLDSSDRMQRMVADVLSWARTSGDLFPVALRADDFASILRGVIEEARVTYGDESVVCEIVGDLRGSFDRDRVHQAIANLVRNAIEHGGGAAEVHASEADEGRSISLVVRNRGPLLSPSSSDISDPFRRRKRPTNARGLGLYIVDRIARAHEATVEMTPAGEDTAICIRWPTRRLVAAIGSRASDSYG